MKIRIAIAAFVFGLISVNSLLSIAGTITSQEAVLVAEKQLVKLGKSQDFSLQAGMKIENKGLTLAFAFNLIPTGYIIISASTSISPVIAYSFESDFGELNQSNPLFEMITSDLTKRIHYTSLPGNSTISKNEKLWKAFLNSDIEPLTDPLFEQWPASGDGWIKTNWTQSQPYNNFCPLDPVTGQRSYAGCPATAMAQIMNFHQTTNSTHFDDSDDYYHNYAGRQYWIDDDFDYTDFPSFPQLNVYLDTMNAHYLNGIPMTNDDKAAMTFACGVAARQVFTSQVSGTFGVSQAYDAYLRFGCNAVDLLDSNDADLFDRLKQNIKDTLPAHLAVVDSTWSMGHNVVVDGYNTDEYYHLNFGWGGSYNGWYLLPQEIPYDLTVIEGVVVDIMETTTGIITPEIIVSETFIYPNPAKDITWVSYSISISSSVIFCLFNISGQEILKFEFKNQEPGKLVFSIPMEKQPAGLYFYTLRTHNSLNSGKIIRLNN